jgi:hypothetical protein
MFFRTVAQLRRGTVSLSFFLLGVALAGCGSGISLDPTSDQPPSSTPNDGGDAGPDVSAEAGNDATDGDRGGETHDGAQPLPDSDEDASKLPDGRDPLDATHVDEGVGDRDAPNETASFDSSADVAVESGLDTSADAQGDIGSQHAADVVADIVSQDGPDAIGDACSDACGPKADYYVDAAASPDEDGDGSSAHPFRTITAAIAAYGSSAQAKTASVAPGTYDEALGEHFPLVLRGLTLVGAGADKTFIVGSGAYDHSAEGGSLNGQYSLTILIGHTSLPTRVANVSVTPRPGSPVPAPNYHGIFCDRGSDPSGLTTMDGVTVGPGYHVSVFAVTSTVPAATGCNLRMVKSTLSGGWLGLYGIGCTAGVGNAPVVLEIGDSDPTNRNVFSWMQGDNTYDVLVNPCVVRATFQHNLFTNSRVGLDVDQSHDPSPEVHHITIANNTFTNLSERGVGLIGTTSKAFVDYLSNNTFTNITKSPGDSTISVALGLTSTISGMLGKMRGNTFVSNDVGVNLVAMNGALGAPPDFGTLDDPGGNSFRCNSSALSPGADVWIGRWSPDTIWEGVVPFAGNAWDHVPPTLLSSDSFPDGTDIVIATGLAAQPDAGGTAVNASNPTLATAVCPAGKTP